MRAILPLADENGRKHAGCYCAADVRGFACRAGLTADKNKPPAGGLSIFAIWPLSDVAA
jgi:hypothetical protein